MRRCKPPTILLAISYVLCYPNSKVEKSNIELLPKSAKLKITEIYNVLVSGKQRNEQV